MVGWHHQLNGREFEYNGKALQEMPLQTLADLAEGLSTLPLR